MSITGVTVACVYCNSATREAFGYVFEGLFKVIEKATGKHLKFKAFDPSGNSLSVNGCPSSGFGRCVGPTSHEQSSHQ
jgi:hypothetical protein